MMRNGITREMIKGDKWIRSNAEAFVISQTLGGSIADVDESVTGEGGEFGGGGASGNF